MESVVKRQDTGSENKDSLDIHGQNTDNEEFDKQLHQVAPFPDEILDMIFQRLKHPQDVINVSKASPILENVVATTKPSWLFYEVFAIVFPVLDKSSILNCRLVCKRWKESVQNTLDNHHSERPYDPMVDLKLTPATLNYHKKTRDADIEKDFTKFFIGPDHSGRVKTPTWWLRELKGHQGNPFVTKYIENCNVDYNPRSDYWINMMKFLKVYGSYILHFKMLIQKRSTDYLGFYYILRQCLQLLPNLKTLVFSCCNGTLRHNQTKKNVQHSRLKQFIRQYPLPERANLCSLYVVIEESDLTRSQELIVAELFRRYQKQLGKVKVDPDWCCEVPQLNKYLGLANNITDLQLTVTSDIHGRGGSAAEAFLIEVPSLPNLAKLRIKFGRFSYGHNLQAIMMSLYKFAKLRVLVFLFHFRQEIFEDREILNPYKEQLPSIKILDVNFMTYYGFFYDALLCYLPCLEYLNLNHIKDLEIDEKISDEVNHMVKIGDNKYEIYKGLSLGDMFKSKVWKEILTLKEITCSYSSIIGEEVEESERWDKLFRYTRERYDFINEHPETN